MKNYFISRENTRGQSLPTDKVENGKVVCESKTFSDSVTDLHWNNHFEGKVGLGLSPILLNNNVRWACIDIDNYNIDIEKISIKFSKLPFLFCRTKSGGLHVFIFFNKEVKAKNLRYQLRELYMIMQLPPSFDKKGNLQPTEIFPVQDSTKIESLGNWVNLPYFNKNNTNRYCIYNGVKLSYEQFVKVIEKNQISGLKKYMEKFIFYGCPPCIQKMLSNGVTDGQRNMFYTNAVVFLKKKYPDTWKNKVLEVNTEKYLEPLSQKEISTIISYHAKTDCKYQCQNNMKPYCNKDDCRGRAHGFMTENSPDKCIGELTKVLTDTGDLLYWIVEVYGVKIKMETEELLEQKKFHLLVVNFCNKVLPSIKEYEWKDIIGNRLDNRIEKIAPRESSPNALIDADITAFFMHNHISAYTEEDFDRTKILVEDGYYYFRSKHLLQYLVRKKHNVKPQWLYSHLTATGAESLRKSINKTQINVYKLPVFEEHKNKTKPDYRNPPDFTNLPDFTKLDGEDEKEY